MRGAAFKIRKFARLASKTGLTDADLLQALEEIEAGLIDANLGGGLIKKRIARRGSGRSSGYRVIVAVKHEDTSFFVLLFAKNEQDNIDKRELLELKDLAEFLFGLSEVGIQLALAEGELEKIE